MHVQRPCAAPWRAPINLIPTPSLRIDEAMANPATITKFPGRTILVVDDEEQIRTALTSLLEREGYTVTSAEGPTEALEILRQQPIKLVISDHNMPDMSGIEFFRLIRERHPHVCRIMLTGDPERETIIRAVNEGEVYRFLPKPWNNTTIRVTVYFAFEAIQLEEENRRLVKALRRQLQFVRTLERDFPYLAALARQEEAELLLAQADRAGEE
ncbi:MAG: response regulator [Deltaproteobacteria bacterium]|nr:MAG: response regulator [Deltaproteobacteria bacterium]